MHSVSALAAVAIASLVSSVAGHAHIIEIKHAGKCYRGYDKSIKYDNRLDPNVIGWFTTVEDDGFVSPTAYQKPEIICHRGGKPGSLELKVAAGDRIRLEYDQWLVGHQGPVMDYIADCNGPCKDVNPGNLRFEKVAEMGLLSKDGKGSEGNRGTWASDWIHNNNYGWYVNIPKQLAPGHYVLRNEIISHHNSFKRDGAQHYVQCINLKVTGSGTEKPVGVPATSFYKIEDPSLFFNIWEPRKSYKIPGPEKWEFAGDAASQGDGLPNTNKRTLGPKERMPTRPRNCSKSKEPLAIASPSVADDSDNNTPVDKTPDDKTPVDKTPTGTKNGSNQSPSPKPGNTQTDASGNPKPKPKPQTNKGGKKHPGSKKYGNRKYGNKKNGNKKYGNKKQGNRKNNTQQNSAAQNSCQPPNSGY